MNQDLAIFLVIAIAIAGAVVLILGSARIKAQSRVAELKDQANRDSARAAQLTIENLALRDQVGRQEARLQVLERIATDPGARTAAEIEALR